MMRALLWPVMGRPSGHPRAQISTSNPCALDMQHVRRGVTGMVDRLDPKTVDGFRKIPRLLPRPFLSAMYYKMLLPSLNGKFSFYSRTQTHRFLATTASKFTRLLVGNAESKDRIQMCPELGHTCSIIQRARQQLLRVLV